MTISKFIIKNHKPNKSGNIFSGRYTQIFNILHGGYRGFYDGYYEHHYSPGMIGNDYHLWIGELPITASHWKKLKKLKGVEFVEEIEI